MQQLLQWKSNECYIFCVCVCSLGYPALNACVLYCHLWSVRLCSIFPLYAVKCMIFEKKVIEKKMCFLSLHTVLSETFLITRRIEEISSKVRICLYVEYPLFSTDFTRTWIFSTDFRKIIECKISWKSAQWNPNCSMQTNRQTQTDSRWTDVTKLIVACSNFANALKKER